MTHMYALCKRFEAPDWMRSHLRYCRDEAPSEVERAKLEEAPNT